MSKIRVRRLDGNWEQVYGNGASDFITDIDAVMQIVQTRLRLWQGEWWEYQKEGLPMLQKILGKKGTVKSVADRLIKKRMIESPFVTKIVSFISSYNPNNREYTCLAVLQTEFGIITVTNGGQ